MWNPFRSGPPKPMPPPVPFPWAMAGSAAVALVALFITNGGIFIPVLIVGLLLPGVWTRPRLDDEPVWVARLVLMGIVLTVGFSEPPPDVDGFIDPRVAGLFGQVCAAEVIIILWRRRAAMQGLWAFPGFILLAACNTFDERWVRWMVPPYFLLTALGARGGRARTENGTAAPVRRGTTLTLAGAAVLMLLLGAASYAGVYLYRGPLNALGMKLLATQHSGSESSGMSSQPQLGATFSLRGSLQRVLRIEGPLGDPHLRGQAFDTYRGGRWYPNENERHLIPVGDALRSPISGEATRVIHLNDDGGFLFAPLNVSGLHGPVSLTWDAQHGGPIATTASAPFVSEYGTEASSPALASQSRESPSAFWAAPDRAERVRCLFVPSDIDPRVVRLAHRILTTYDDPIGKMRAVEAYLISHHAYSLSYTPGPGDPVSGFLLSNKPAHCEYFAASAALLLRCAGIPTRYVTGYYAHESAGANVTIVRQQDAHAWCEAYVDGAGWMTVDATPGGGRPDHTAAAAPDSRRWGEWTSDQIAAFRRWVEALSVRDRWLLVGVLAVVLIVPQIVRARRRRTALVPAEFSYAAPDTEEVRDFAFRFTRWLARSGIPCPPERLWSLHLRLEETEALLTPAARQQADEFVRVYSRLRFGPLPRADDARAARALLGELDKENAPAAVKETVALP